MLFVTLLFFVTFQLVENNIYLYNTEDEMSVEFFDCFTVDGLQYCRRPDQLLDVIRDNNIVSCEENGGRFHSFSALESTKINISSILHEWKSGMERVEQYSRYRKVLDKDKDGHICQCVRSGSFGKICEYQLPFGTTIAQTIQWQLEMKENNPWKVQKYGDIVCYKGIQCDSGLLCLDWRDICDGLQHCMFGYDENNCDILELNQCDDDEYRCMNGMCIPDEYFIDGQYDCLDWSDEISSIKEDYLCYDEVASVECDDRICHPNQWSCGDGQCIEDRFEFQKPNGFLECLSRREQYFICETAILLQWTMPNGRCFAQRHKELPIKNRTEYEQCVYLLKCTLSQGLEEGCSCWRNSNCIKILHRDCSLDTIQYPSNGIIGPYGYFLFNRNRTSSDRVPHWLVINGTVNCRGFFISRTKTIRFNGYLNIPRIIELEFCTQSTNQSFIGNPDLVQPCYRTNDSFDICNESRTCLSSSRLKDGFYSCENRKDETTHVDIEKSCDRVKRHRFRCSINESTCFSVMTLGNQWKECENGFDQFWFGMGHEVSEMHCNKRRTDECSLLRRYIEQSWLSLNTIDIRSQLGMPFHWYCDSFWDLDSGEDESIDLCRQWWICIHYDKKRCRTGQCISAMWFLDSEWDCADGSDQENSFYQRIETLEQLNPNSSSINESQSRFGICNKTHPFVCLSYNTTLNQYTCLTLNQVGDKVIDCLGSIDEHHTLKNCDGSSILGLNFKCSSDNVCIPFSQHCQVDYMDRCPNHEDDEQWCFHRNSSSDCSGNSDFVCFDGKCASHGRCDKRWQCSFGEDEYMCDYRTVFETIDSYRHNKKLMTKGSIPPLELFHFPYDANITQIQKTSTTTETSLDNSSSIAPYRCNRGLGILSSNNHSIICFCPPQYYGNYCQYHSDRFLLLLHLNLSQSIYSLQNHQEILLKILLLFFFENQLLIINQFHVHPTLEFNTIYKKHFHFVYSNSMRAREERMKRYFNRSHILDSHPYSIRIEIYETQRDREVLLIAVWQYSIIFDYLPVFRLAKVLRLTRTGPCLTNPCHPNEQCQRLINDKSKYICLCKSNFTGPNCSIEDPRCTNGFCTGNALCKVDYQMPYCICPYGRYGDRCDIEHNDICQSNVCLNDGTCFPGSTFDQVICLCQKDFYGSHCQYQKALVHSYLHNYTLTYSAVVFQYFNIDFRLLSLNLVHQQVYTNLRSSIIYEHEGKVLAEIFLAKVYSSYEDTQAKFYLLSLHIDLKTESIQQTIFISEHNYCQSIAQISNEFTSPINYHHVCIRNKNLLCFHDKFYVCICHTNHTHVYCFLYDRTLDQCSFCLADGLCVRGNRIRSNDFVCLCPSCYSGYQCQFNSKLLTVTLDQLFYVDLTSNHKQTTMNGIIIGTIVLFLIALPNNLFSYTTLHRQSCQLTGIGHYLLFISLINQINLGFLVGRLSHLSNLITQPQSFSMINHILCKLLNYFLVCFTRVSYWFASFVGLERAYSVVFMNGQWFKKPHTARNLMILTLIIIFVSSTYEIVFVKLFISDIDSKNTAMCVVEFPTSHQAMWIVIHQTVSILHSTLPLLINICSTVTIIYIVIRNKMNIHKTKQRMQQPVEDLNTRGRLNLLRDVFNEHKEIISRPIIAFIPSIFSLFSLPLIVVSLSLTCQTDEINRLRYLLIASYFMSLIPQMITFFLYIYPSTLYSKEWQATAIAKRIDTVRQQLFSLNIIFRSK